MQYVLVGTVVWVRLQQARYSTCWRLWDKSNKTKLIDDILVRLTFDLLSGFHGHITPNKHHTYLYRISRSLWVFLWFLGHHTQRHLHPKHTLSACYARKACLGWPGTLGSTSNPRLHNYRWTQALKNMRRDWKGINLKVSLVLSSNLINWHKQLLRNNLACCNNSI